MQWYVQNFDFFVQRTCNNKGSLIVKVYVYFVLFTLILKFSFHFFFLIDYWIFYYKKNKHLYLLFKWYHRHRHYCIDSLCSSERCIMNYPRCSYWLHLCTAFGSVILIRLICYSVILIPFHFAMLYLHWVYLKMLLL